jgi:transposase InsO family protein
MPWKTMTLDQERGCLVKLVLHAQQTVAELSRAFKVSRKTAYKWKERFLQKGVSGLADQSRRPTASPTQLSDDWVERIRRVRRQHRRWGAKKIRAVLQRRHPRQQVPALRTITRWLQRLRLSRPRRRRPARGPVVVLAKLTRAKQSNQVWTVDFKGWWRTADGQRADPLTVRDLFSRYLLAVRLLPNQQWWRVQVVFRRLFRQYGLPRVIRVDNGGPFASAGKGALSRLSAWWTILGIRVEFTRPAHPQDNGAHEQMHRVLKAETTRPPSSNLRAQQRRLDRWRRIYNQERPHEALRQQTPAQHYQPGRSYQAKGVPKVKYPAAWEQRGVRSNGQIRWQGRLRFIGEAVVGCKVGLKELSPEKWSVYLAGILLGELHASDAGALRPAAYVRQRPTNPKQKV